jgi:hypothetical protein
MAIKYIKWPQNIQNVHKLYQNFPFQGPPRYIKIGIVGMKINHLATLVPNLSPAFWRRKVIWSNLELQRERETKNRRQFFWTRFFFQNVLIKPSDSFAFYAKTIRTKKRESTNLKESLWDHFFRKQLSLALNRFGLEVWLLCCVGTKL